MPKKIAVIVGARPNFMKAAPLMKQLRAHGDEVTPFLIHTGQHYDRNLSELFFEQLKMAEPDLYLGVGSGTHAQQTAKIMVELESHLMADDYSLIVVFGDVNSTLAASVVAAKLLIPIGHVEAGLRSFDHAMPEEINRIVTDRLSDLLFVHEQSGLDNLKAEGVPDEKVHFTGNIMIDSLVGSLEACKDSTILKDMNLEPQQYAVVTMHRPSNVDNADLLKELLSTLNDIGKQLPIIFPCHPRTKHRMAEKGVLDSIDTNNLKIIDPVGYLDFLRLQSQARLVLTDSGGVQEETTYLQIPCITMRHNTERPVTVDVGSNVLVGPNPDKIRKAAEEILAGKGKKGEIPRLWDGNTAGRITEIILQYVK